MYQYIRMKTKEQLLKKVAELQAIIETMDSNEESVKKFLLDQINGSVQSWEEGSNDIDWYKDDEFIMGYNRKSKWFYLNNSIYSGLESKYKLDIHQINKTCSKILKEHFNCIVTSTANTTREFYK